MFYYGSAKKRSKDEGTERQYDCVCFNRRTKIAIVRSIAATHRTCAPTTCTLFLIFGFCYTLLVPKVSHVIIGKGIVAEHILSLEGLDRPVIRAQVFRALQTGLLYIRYKNAPYQNIVWQIIRN